MGIGLAVAGAKRRRSEIQLLPTKDQYIDEQSAPDVDRNGRQEDQKSPGYIANYKV